MNNLSISQWLLSTTSRCSISKKIVLDLEKIFSAFTRVTYAAVSLGIFVAVKIKNTHNFSLFYRSRKV